MCWFLNTSVWIIKSLWQSGRFNESKLTNAFCCFSFVSFYNHPYWLVSDIYTSCICGPPQPCALTHFDFSNLSYIFECKWFSILAAHLEPLFFLVWFWTLINPWNTQSERTETLSDDMMLLRMQSTPDAASAWVIICTGREEHWWCLRTNWTLFSENNTHLFMKWNCSNDEVCVTATCLISCVEVKNSQIK